MLPACHTLSCSIQFPSLGKDRHSRIPCYFSPGQAVSKMIFQRKKERHSLHAPKLTRWSVICWNEWGVWEGKQNNNIKDFLYLGPEVLQLLFSKVCLFIRYQQHWCKHHCCCLPASLQSLREWILQEVSQALMSYWGSQQYYLYLIGRVSNWGNLVFFLQQRYAMRQQLL